MVMARKTPVLTCFFIDAPVTSPPLEVVPRLLSSPVDYSLARAGSTDLFSHVYGVNNAALFFK
jgi:hypothetical protein